MSDPIPTPLSEGHRLARAMDDAITALKIKVGEAASAERDYRKKKSDKYIEAKDMDVQAAAKTAWVDAQTADDRYKRDVADGMKQALLEEVRNFRQQMSFAQTVARADGEERDVYRFNQSGQV